MRLSFAVAPDGVQLHVAQAGSGRSLLFVHGTGADKARWDAVEQLLRPRLATASYDRRGRGFSGDHAAYSLAREIDDLVCVAASVGHGDAVDVVAHSFGALVAFAAAIAFPRAFRTLTLYEAPIATAGASFTDIAKVSALEAVLTRDGPEAAVVYFQSEFPRSSAAEISDLQASPMWPARVRSAHTMPRELRAAAEFDIDAAPAWPAGVPGQLLLGADSIGAFHDSASAVSARMGSAPVVTLSGQRHRAMDTIPEVVATHLVNYLEEHR